MLPFTLLEILGVGAEWESRFILPGGGWEMLPMAKDGINGEAAVDPILGRHILAAFGLATDHDEQKLIQANMFLS